MEFTCRFFEAFEKIQGRIANFSQYTQKSMLNWLTKLLGLKNKLILPVIYKMHTRNRKKKKLFYIVFLWRENEKFLSLEVLQSPPPILQVLSPLPSFRFWEAKLTGFMRKGDTVNQGPSPWQHKHPGQNAQCNQTGCSEAAGEEHPGWGSPTVLTLPAEQAS